MLFDVGDELLHDSVIVGADVGRVDDVGIIVIGAGVLEGHGHHPRKIFRGPQLVKRISFSEAMRSPQRKMALDIAHRVEDFRMSLVSFRKEDSGSQIDGLSPELRQDFTLELSYI